MLNKKLNISSSDYILLFNLLSQKETRLIGGCVRDALINKPNSDIDIVTTYLPDQVEELMLQNHIKTLDVGKKYGTIIAIYKDQKFEITTARRDIKNFGRYAEVEFTNDFEEDALRRDFTINAMSYNPIENCLFDYCNGYEDLLAKKVRFIGDPHIRINEDFLRIMRFFRFSAAYAQDIDLDGLDVCISLKENLVNISKERIKFEFDRLIMVDDPFKILHIMNDAGILNILFGIEKLYNYRINNLSRLARYALLYYHKKNIDIKYFLNLKFTKQEAKQIQDFLYILNSTVNLKSIWYEKHNYEEYFNLLIAANICNDLTIKSFLQNMSNVKPVFPIKVVDIISHVEQNKISHTLNFLRQYWIDTGFKLSKEELLRLINDI